MASKSDLMREALSALKEIRERDAEWERDAKDYARDGFRPQHCRHGVSMWVDYDCACWQCEQALSPHEEALGWAYSRITERARRADAEAAWNATLEGMEASGTITAEQAEDLRKRGPVR